MMNLLCGVVPTAMWSPDSKHLCRESCRLLAVSEGATSANAGRFVIPVSANRGVHTTPIVVRGRHSSAIGIEDVGIESTAPDSGVTLLVDPDLPVSPRDSLLDALEHDLVCEGMTPSTVPASSRAVRAARFISPTQRKATVPAVSQDALEREVGHGVGPTVVDMSFDDTDQDEEVAMAGNRLAAPSDHNSDRSEGGVRDIRPSRRLVNRLMLYPRAITSGMPTQTASRERQTLKWEMWSNPQQRRFQS